PGAVITQATLDGYGSTVAKVRAPNEQAEILMSSGGSTVRGTAISRLTDKPVAGAKIWVEAGSYMNSVLTNEEGEFEFTGLAAGSYELFGVKGMRSERQEVELGRN